VPSGWAVCSAADENKVKNNTSILVEIGNFKVTVNDGDDMGLFSKVCKSLVSLC
jgi:hypothetical protein